MPDDQHIEAAPVRSDYTVKKGAVSLAVYRKRLEAERGEYDGIASEEDLLDFYRLLPNPDRQFVVMPGAAHALVFGRNRHQLWHVVHAFLTMPERRDSSHV